MSHSVYPPTPFLEDKSFLLPSSAFKQKLKSVTTGIAIFIATYFVVLGITAELAYLCVYGGFTLLMLYPSWITLIVGGGIAGLGVMMALFFLKVLFASKSVSMENQVELKYQEHPDLFEFVHQVAADVGAPSPNKIFLTPDVNASVFYNSSFWSLFKPATHKNLNIGIGLMNSLNLSEFKAVLAHEFGHFSQDSMQLGSYVYTVNRVIHDMVFRYDKWDQVIQEWANAGGVFGFFGLLTYKIANGLRSLLIKGYQFVNKRYSGLAREMEYQADFFAVSVAGNRNAISALRRVVFGSAAYEQTMSQLSRIAKEEKRVDNLFDFQRKNTIKLARHHKLEMLSGLPIVTDEVIQALDNSRVMYEDQWASHPKQTDRETSINSVSVESIVDERSPMFLLGEQEAIEEKFTELVYSNIPEASEWHILPVEKIETQLEEEEQKVALPEVCKEFYDGRVWSEFNVAKLTRKNEQAVVEFEEIFSSSTKKRIDRLSQNEADLVTLQCIASGSIDVATFEFDGTKYHKKESKKAIQQLSEEIEVDKKWLKKLDKQAFLHHFNLAKEIGLSEKYVKYFTKYHQLQSTLSSIDNFLITIHERYHELAMHVKVDEEDMQGFLNTLQAVEREFKELMIDAEEDGLLKKAKETYGETILSYVTEPHRYYMGARYFSQSSFDQLLALMSDSHDYLSTQFNGNYEKLIGIKKQLILEKQP